MGRDLNRFPLSDFFRFFRLSNLECFERDHSAVENPHSTSFS